jgi:hypothetical protein
MAAHGREDKGPGIEGFKKFNGRLDNFGNVCDSAAAGCKGHTVSRLNLIPGKLLQFGQYGFADIGYPGAVKMLPNAAQLRERHHFFTKGKMSV